jgi:hypothetical protein
MIHTHGVKPVSDQRLLRRNGHYYYRRRVPLHLVATLGKNVVQLSLQTTSLKEAKSCARCATSNGMPDSKQRPQSAQRTRSTKSPS